MAEEVVSRPQPSLESPALSSAADAGGQLYNSSSVKRVKVDNSSTAPLHHVAPTMFTLPVELLIEILAQLNTLEVGVVMQVCKTWRDVANNTTRVWRNIAFTDHSRRICTYADVELTNAVERAGGKVVSVDLSGLSDYAIRALCRLLDSSSLTLRHIFWSYHSYPSTSAEAVYELAKRCPHLQTLQLRCKEQAGTNGPFRWSLDKFTQEACGDLRLHTFNISIDLLEDDEPLQPMIYDEAKAVEIHAYNAEGISLVELARLFKCNPAIETLSLQGVSQESEMDRVRHLNAPALTSLHLRDIYLNDDEEQPHPEVDLPTIHAPHLRELDIDAGVLFKMTPCSIATLDCLSLHFGVCMPPSFRPTFESHCLELAKHHRGRLQLSLTADCAQEVLTILSDGFCWPGLDSVSIELGNGLAGTLVRLIAARQAGARGASEEQYLSVLHETSPQRMTGTPQDSRQRRLTNDLKLTPKVASAEDIIRATSGVQFNSSAPPLCSEVLWSICAQTSLPETIWDWLHAQSNVD